MPDVLAELVSAVKSTQVLLRFQLLFWPTSGILLLLVELGLGQPQSALLRISYLPLIGLFTSYSLVILLAKRGVHSARSGFLRLLVMSGAMACAMALLVNPIIDGLLGIHSREPVSAVYVQDLLYFLFSYLLWCIVYLLKVADAATLQTHQN